MPPPILRWIELTITLQDKRLLQQAALTAETGPEWSPSGFPDRTSLSAKNRYSILLRKQGAVRQSPLTASTATAQSPSASTMNGGPSVCNLIEFDIYAVLRQQQSWNSTPNNMPHTWYYSDSSPSRDMLNPAAAASPFTGPGVDGTVACPEGTLAAAAQSSAEANYQIQFARFPSPSAMSVDSFLGAEFGELCHTGSSTGRVGGGSQGMVGVGGPFSLVEGPDVVWYIIT